MAAQHSPFCRQCLAVAALALACAPAAVHAETVEELRELLKQRDAEIADLKRRLQEATKGRAGQQPAPPATIPATPAANQAATPGAPASSVPTAVAPDSKIAPDDDAINRALERALVDRGGLLLPVGRFELQPALAYSRADGASGFPRSDILGTSLSLRAGLPWQSQMQLSIPYSLRTRIRDEHAAGLGDVSLAVATQLLGQRDQLPSLIGALGWTAPTGRDGFSGGVPLGSGFHTFGAGLTALKRLDPLVLIGGFSYSASPAEQVQGRRVRPGPVTGLRFGGGIAISPETSFDLGISLNSIRLTKIDGQRVAGSDDVVGTLDLGFGMVLSRQVFLRVGGQFRLTGSTPDVGLSISVPIRY